MLVYANHLTIEGAGAEAAVVSALRGWFKNQLGFTLSGRAVRSDGEYEGRRGDTRSWLRIVAADDGDPRMYAWILKNTDAAVPGRQWVTEVGLKDAPGGVDLSCVVRTEELSTLVDETVTASSPRLIRYLVDNVTEATDADFAGDVCGLSVKTVGPDTDSYRGLRADIERPERAHVIVLVSPTRNEEYLVDPERLQRQLVGLAQVVSVDPQFDSYELEEVIGRHWSAWAGAINILHTPAPNGFVRGKLFLADQIRDWGAHNTRLAKILAWVTNNTNIPRSRKRIQPEGVKQLALRRRLEQARARREEMDEGQLRQELDGELEAVWELAMASEESTKALEAQNEQLQRELDTANSEIGELRDEGAKREYTIQSLKDRLEAAGQSSAPDLDAARLIEWARRSDPPTPRECLDLIEEVFPAECVVLESARDSARKSGDFLKGRQLLDMLRRLVTEYRVAVLDGGDSKAREVFGNNHYAAQESEKVKGSKPLRRARTFQYRGEDVEMFQHLKIGVDDDTTKTLRVHFAVDSERGKIVIGYCGEHLPVPSH